MVAKEITCSGILHNAGAFVANYINSNTVRTRKVYSYSLHLFIRRKVKNLAILVRFQVFMVASMKVSLVGVDKRIIALMVQTVRTSQTSVYFNETTRCYIPQGCHHLGHFGLLQK
jgi:hypothetical protein